MTSKASWIVICYNTLGGPETYVSKTKYRAYVARRNKACIIKREVILEFRNEDLKSMSLESTGSYREEIIEESGNEIGTEFEIDLEFPDEVLCD